MKTRLFVSAWAAADALVYAHVFKKIKLATLAIFQGLSRLLFSRGVDFNGETIMTVVQTPLPDILARVGSGVAGGADGFITFEKKESGIVFTYVNASEIPAYTTSYGGRLVASTDSISYQRLSDTGAFLLPQRKTTTATSVVDYFHWAVVYGIPNDRGFAAALSGISPVLEIPTANPTRWAFYNLGFPPPISSALHRYAPADWGGTAITQSNSVAYDHESKTGLVDTLSIQDTTQTVVPRYIPIGGGAFVVEGTRVVADIPSRVRLDRTKCSVQKLENDDETVGREVEFSREYVLPYAPITLKYLVGGYLATGDLYDVVLNSKVYDGTPSERSVMYGAYATRYRIIKEEAIVDAPSTHAVSQNVLGGVQAPFDLFNITVSSGAGIPLVAVQPFTGSDSTPWTTMFVSTDGYGHVVVDFEAQTHYDTRDLIPSMYENGQDAHIVFLGRFGGDLFFALIGLNVGNARTVIFKNAEQVTTIEGRFSPSLNPRVLQINGHKFIFGTTHIAAPPMVEKVPTLVSLEDGTQYILPSFFSASDTDLETMVFIETQAFGWCVVVRNLSVSTPLLRPKLTYYTVSSILNNSPEAVIDIDLATMDTLEGIPSSRHYYPMPYPLPLYNIEREGVSLALFTA